MKMEGVICSDINPIQLFFAANFKVLKKESK